MEKNFKVEVTTQQANELIQKLATDDAFRRQLQKDPATTLAKFNLTLPDRFLGKSFKLPPKADFQAMINDLKIGSQSQPRVAAFIAFLAFFAFFKK